MSEKPVSTVGLLAVLTFFFVVGSAMALFIWHTLSDFVAGQPVEGGAYLLALVLIVAFMGLAWLLARYIRSVVGSA